MVERLALGTVQFGMPYGIAGRSEQMDLDEVTRILGGAASAGMDTLDTAISYGSSEERLGVCGIEQWRTISKLPEVPEEVPDLGIWVRNQVAASLRRLRVDSLYAILLHKPAQLLGKRGEELYAALFDLKVAGMVQKVGISIYDPMELDVLEGLYQLDLVQSPFNVLDRRIESSGWLGRLAKRGVEVHVRSVFLQGLLLMDAQAVPAYFSRWLPVLDRWQAWCSEVGVSPHRACLSLALSERRIDRVIVGVDSLEQLEQVLEAAACKTPVPPLSLAVGEPELLNPSQWRHP